MWLRFAIKGGKRVSIRITKRDYAQLLRRFSVEGAESGATVYCPLCENVDYDCNRCVFFQASERLSGTWMIPCFHVVPGLREVCKIAEAKLYDDKEKGDRTSVRHCKDVRRLRNFRRRLIRAARKEKPQ